MPGLAIYPGLVFVFPRGACGHRRPIRWLWMYEPREAIMRPPAGSLQVVELELEQSSNAFYPRFTCRVFFLPVVRRQKVKGKVCSIGKAREPNESGK